MTDRTAVPDRDDDLHEIVASRLRRSRQRYTSGRRHLVDLLAHGGRPLAVPEILGDDAAQSQSSVYRNLAILEQCEVVHRLAAPDETIRYELVEDLTEHHHHVVCEVCGRMEDVSLSADVEHALHDAVVQAQVAHGFVVDVHRLDLVGQCGDCA